MPLKQLQHLADGELMALLAEGNTDVLGVLYLRHGDAILRFLCRILNDSFAVEDVCQEVFIAVSQSAKRYQEQGKLRSWIFKIAARKARAHNRKAWVRERLHRHATQQAKVDGQGSKGKNDTKEESIHDLSKAYSALPHKLREVLALHVGEGMTGDQIAETLGISPGAARVRLHRARQSIQQALQDDANELPFGAYQ